MFFKKSHNIFIPHKATKILQILIFTKMQWHFFYYLQKYHCQQKGTALIFDSSCIVL
jgi:hypothetical protein